MKIQLLSLIAIFLCASVYCEERPPNIILLLADDLGWTGVGCYGSDLHETPHIDRLAAQGLMFTDAYSACTVCSPTRASLMTGKYPARLHLTDFIAGQNRPHEKVSIPQWTKYMKLDEVTVAESLRAADYATVHVGKWHLSPPQPPAGHTADEFGPEGHGFDISIVKPPGTKGFFLPKDLPRADGSRGGYLTDYLTDGALRAVDQFKDRPFFMYFAYHNPHTPIQGKADLVEYYRDKLAKNPKARHANPAYAAMIHSLDESVGRIVAKVDELELGRDTIVIFTSDNGGLTQRYGKIDGIADNFPLRRGKGSAYEGGVRVPMIARWPGVVRPGTRCAEPVMTIDFYPTALEIAGTAGDARHNANLDGVSLLGLFGGRAATLERDALFWHYPHYHAGGDAPYSAMRIGRWRLVEFHDDTPPALYDLVSDLGERHDLADAQAGRLLDMQEKLHAWRRSVNAQIPAENPDYDPSKAGKPAPRRKRR